MSFWQLKDRNSPEKCRIDYRTPEAEQYLAHTFYTHLCKTLPNKASPVVIVPIGTDRSTGDALGPLVGSFLKEKNIANLHCLGCLEEPVHAANLESKLHTLKIDFPSAYIIAVDACLGELNAIGTINFGAGAIRPGAGVNKTLPPVGNCHFTGIVNVGGYMEYLVLQNTRLSFVMGMAKIITGSIAQGFAYFQGQGELLSDMGL